MTGGNPLLEKLDAIDASLEKLAAAVKMADPSAIRAAASTGAEAGARSATSGLRLLETTDRLEKAAGAVVEASRQVSQGIPPRLAWIALAGFLAAFMGMFLLGRWTGHTEMASAAANQAVADQAQLAEAWRLVAAVPEAVKWLNSPAGKLAKRWSDDGRLKILAQCSGKGWQVLKDGESGQSFCATGTNTGFLIDR